ncbi:MAG TPA: TIGR02757 family protein [Ignavibacteria bacterium]|nr:TIGR02757 family protein [Ignavibacteria bacterium]
MNKTDLKKYLEQVYNQYKHKHSSKDPVWVLHKFVHERDIEIAGLIVSCFAYGQVDQINKFTGELFSRTSMNIYEFTANFNEQKDKKFLRGLYYRFNDEKDLVYLFKNLNRVLKEHGSLKKVFLKHHKNENENILDGLTGLVGELRKETQNKNQKETQNIASLRYLLPSPEDNSTCKRLNLFMRWMVRKDDIDLGIWKEIDKSKLVMPVDTHIYKVTQKLKMVKRKSCDLKYAVELTNELKEFDADDPVKYDFALCHVRLDKKF